MKKVLQFVLSNDSDERKTISISDINFSMDQTDVKACADVLASSGIFIGKKGIFTRVISARIVETQYTEFEVA